MELVLGAYTAGMVIAMLVRDTRAEILQNRLMSIGSGFFIPVFFITSGVEFDLPGLLTSPGSIARLILFCAGFLLIRIIPVRLYKGVLPENDLLPLALLSSTTLPLAVAVTYLGVRTGDMLPENAHALVGAAVITVAVFPALALVLRAKGKARNPKGTVAIAIHRAANLASVQFSRFLGFVTQKNPGTARSLNAFAENGGYSNMIPKSYRLLGRRSCGKTKRSWAHRAEPDSMDYPTHILGIHILMA